ncbi:MAG: hypothetical protein ABI042_08640 [Verrucomicrobiota bacterium]
MRVPFGSRRLFQQRGDLAEQRRRGHMAGQQAQTRADIGFPLLSFSRDDGKEAIPDRNIISAQHGLGTIRIVEREDFGLHENIARAETRRMLGVALDLGRATFVTFHEHAARIAAERQGRGKIKRVSPDEFFRLLNIRHDFFQRLPRASAQT